MPTKASNVFQVSGGDELKKIIDTKGKLIIMDFWAPRCGPCRMIAPILEKIVSEFPEDTILVKVNVDDSVNQALAISYGVSGIPQINIFKDGIQIDGFVGAQPYETVKAKISKLLGK